MQPTNAYACSPFFLPGPSNPLHTVQTNQQEAHAPASAKTPFVHPPLFPSQDLHTRLHDPTLLQACPPPPQLNYFKRAPDVGLAASSDASGRNAWGSTAHPFTAPVGVHQLLLAGYNPQDTAKRRQAEMPVDSDEDDPEGLPPPPIVMEQTR